MLSRPTWEIDRPRSPMGLRNGGNESHESDTDYYRRGIGYRRLLPCTDLSVLPMTIRFGDEEYLDGVNLTPRQFYEKMIETQVLPTTSQPSPMPSRLQSEKSMNRATLH